MIGAWRTHTAQHLRAILTQDVSLLATVRYVVFSEVTQPLHVTVPKNASSTKYLVLAKLVEGSLV